MSNETLIQRHKETHALHGTIIEVYVPCDVPWDMLECVEDAIADLAMGKPGKSVAIPDRGQHDFLVGSSRMGSCIATCQHPESVTA